MNQSLFLLDYMRLAERLLETPPVHTGEWQSMDTSGSSAHATYELQHVTNGWDIPATKEALEDMMAPNVEWANAHFDERVGGEPLNPPPSHKLWPWARHNGGHQRGYDGPFSHSYPERYWPRFAVDINAYPATMLNPQHGRHGIRYRWGDLNDVVAMLTRSPFTRQAYLPVWFPEDTGATEGQRVPCTLGYHFMIRNSVMDCMYAMRSCDLVRHYRDDMYLTGRLTQWVCNQLNINPNFPFLITPGQIITIISSLHAFVGDKYRLQLIAKGDLS